MSGLDDKNVSSLLSCLEKALSVIEEKEAEDSSIPESEKRFTRELSRFAGSLHTYVDDKTEDNMRQVDEAYITASVAKRSADKMAVFITGLNTCHSSASTGQTVHIPCLSPMDERIRAKERTKTLEMRAKIAREGLAKIALKSQQKNTATDEEKESLQQQIDDVRNEYLEHIDAPTLGNE